MWTDTTITAIVVTIPPTLSALASIVIAIRNGRKTDEMAAKQDLTAQKVDATSDKVDTSNEKLVEIHTLTNGSLHQITSDLKVAYEKIAGLEKLMAQMTEAKKKL